MIVIVPDLPPNINGLGDYAFILAKALQGSFATQTRFIVAGNLSYSAKELDGFPVSALPAANGSALFKAVSAFPVEKIIHLHYVGYGYQQRGTAYWLVTALREIKKQFPQIKLLTTFHELFAGSQKPWQSAFWLSGAQKNICKRIYALSDAAVTTRKDFADILLQFQDKPVTAMPVFSNVEESDRPLPLADRKKQLILFSTTNINYSLKNFSHLINRCCEKLGIEEIIFIGQKSAGSFVLDKPVVQKIDLNNHEIAEILRNAYACFIGFPSPQWFGKSGVFAAACAHGCLPLAVGSDHLSDGIEANIQYADVTGPFYDLPLQPVASKAHEWYRQHDIAAQVLQLHKIITSLNTGN